MGSKTFERQIWVENSEGLIERGTVSVLGAVDPIHDLNRV